MRLARIRAEAQRVPGLDPYLARHNHSEIGAERRSRVDERLRAHGFDQLGAAGDRVGGCRPIEDQGSWPDADSDLACRQFGHRRIDRKADRLPIDFESAAAVIDTLELGMRRVTAPR